MSRAAMIALSLSLVACGGPGAQPDAPGAIDAPALDAPRDASIDPPLDAAVELADVEPGERDAAGTATGEAFGATAFLQPLAGLSGAPRTRYLAGQTMFEIDWLVAPAGSTDQDGLGPTYNSTSCQACHFRNGRGAPPLVDGGALVSALLRVGTADGAPDPRYGDQIQPRAIPGVPAEGEVRLRYETVTGAFDDGTPYELVRPRIELSLALGDPDVGPFAMSVRTASATIGQGLLEAIPADAIVARADPDDLDGDGISGRARWIDAPTGAVLGRFGWKAGQPTVEAQNAAALIGDLGLTTALHPDENCPPAQLACRAAPTGGSPELDATRVAALRAFVLGTTVPARRDVDALPVRRGKWLFHDLGCARCHVPRWQTAASHDFPGLANQVIWPYTDLLLHDLGDDLADNRAEGTASGREWRTPPLWGLGLIPVVSGHHRLLHDGRARGPIEAILWHGGEAAPSAARFRALSSADRAALEAFLMSL
ncbi:MAG: di-heme oxidoreductase family protein [Kofleriaceae bacterium]